MSALITLAQSLGLAYLSGISLYATVAILGFAQRAHWIGTMPGLLGHLTNPLVLGVATVLAVIEFLATLIPGVASLWESAHTFIRPPAAAVLAVATAWHADSSLILAAGLLGGGLGLATHVTKLGLRVAVDTSPEPVTNGALNIAELGVLASLSYLVWHHPVLAVIIALILLILTALLVRMVWRALRNLFSGHWRAFFPARETAG
jgi:Na+-transporting methylmalonyl-CoA/oxaloacetate decarboxylase gamma subunit